MRRIYRLLYYHFAIYLPKSYRWWGIGRIIRYALCKRIFEYCGENVNIEQGAFFGAGIHVRIGNGSGIGINASIPDGTVIGENVMMAPNVYVHNRNHRFDRTDIPMRYQGYSEEKPLIVEDDVWIGQDVTIMVGRKISMGSIVAANTVLAKDFPPYSIIGGNPSKLIRSRI